MNQFLIRRVSTQAIEYAIRVSIADPSSVGPFDLENPAPTVSPVVEPGCEALAYEGDVSIIGRPATPTSILEWDGAAPVWVERGGMSAQREHKAAAISSRCNDAILAGFASSALGQPHSYPTKPNDQANLTGSVVRSFYPNVDADWRTPFWCADTKGAWEFRPHTAAQIQRVGEDAVTARLTCMSINEQLQAQIIDAETSADLADINWPDMETV